MGYDRSVAYKLGSELYHSKPRVIDGAFAGTCQQMASPRLVRVLCVTETTGWRATATMDVNNISL
jgi:hypothetical protein